MTTNDVSGNGRFRDIRAPSKSRAPGSYRWPLIVIAFLGVHVVLISVGVAIATHDPTFAVTPDYYDKALNWDKIQAAKRASEKLGWKLAIAPALKVQPNGERAVEISLQDRNGHPVAGAQINITYFHHAHAMDRMKLTGTTAADGKLAVNVPMRWAGFYSFACTADSGGTNFTDTLTQFVSNAP